MPRLLAILALFMLATAGQAAELQLQVDGPLTVHNSYHGYGCTGDNASPAIRWSHAPAGTRSFALTVFDPDARNGRGWWHWLLIDLPADQNHLAGNTMPPAPARALPNDFGQTGWGGPCPPAGDPPHHYVFTIHALDVPNLKLAADASPDQVASALQAHALAEASQTLLWGR